MIDALGIGESANLVEISGVIKWFDASKGYGFIVPDNGWPDVLLHVTVLRRDGYQTAYEGARLVCECVQRAKGYQAFRIFSMDEFYSDPSGADVAATDPRQRHPDQWARAGTGQVVQSAAWVRLPDARRGDTGHLCPYGDLAPLRNDRTASGPICDGPLWAGLKGHDGGRDLSRERLTCLVIALGASHFRVT